MLLVVDDVLFDSEAPVVMSGINFRVPEQGELTVPNDLNQIDD
jgi:hypothetical protein